MRDFRDAKAMAQTLRSSLTAKAVIISHSESLELVSKMFGLADWNTLAAQIAAGREGLAVPPAADARAAAGRYPAIPMRDLVPFPGATYPIFVGRAKTIQALEQAFGREREVVMAIQRNPGVDEPELEDIYEIGVLAGITDIAQLPDGTKKVLTQIYRRVAITAFASATNGFLADVDDLSEGPIPDAPDLIRTAVLHFAAYAKKHAIPMPQVFQLDPLSPAVAQLLVHANPRLREKLDPDLIAGATSRKIRDPGRVADIIATHIKLPIPVKQALLAMLDPVARLKQVDAHLVADEQAG